jgi:hypothetical protein
MVRTPKRALRRGVSTFAVGFFALLTLLAAGPHGHGALQSCAARDLAFHHAHLDQAPCFLCDWVATVSVPPLTAAPLSLPGRTEAVVLLPRNSVWQRDTIAPSTARGPPNPIT